jgi:hypothetical protein
LTGDFLNEDVLPFLSSCSPPRFLVYGGWKRRKSTWGKRKYWNKEISITKKENVKEECDGRVDVRWNAKKETENRKICEQREELRTKREMEN